MRIMARSSQSNISKNLPVFCGFEVKFGNGVAVAKLKKHDGTVFCTMTQINISPEMLAGAAFRRFLILVEICVCDWYRVGC
jgi:hypothetical protein